MKLHEHQAKTIFADAGIPVPDSRLATTVDEALDAVDEIGYPAAIKAQVHVGGRGKAGGSRSRPTATRPSSTPRRSSGWI